MTVKEEAADMMLRDAQLYIKGEQQKEWLETREYAYSLLADLRGQLRGDAPELDWWT